MVSSRIAATRGRDAEDLRHSSRSIVADRGMSGTVVWLLGNNLGLAIGLLFGNWLASGQYMDPNEVDLGFCSPIWLIALASSLAWLMCCSTNLLCSLHSYIIEPADLVDDV